MQELIEGSVVVVVVVVVLIVVVMVVVVLGYILTQASTLTISKRASQNGIARMRNRCIFLFQNGF